ncbi:zinc finger protein 235-like [Pseudoliparis swirei]|uniref:zinc finger protein 235-like n=1 Tax=Pseudoliparis swirei TaxID=2059687 RepID=UPI0024BDB3B0|nr:zinc finger protein 235-like [Pseudoliparis swirei]
MSSVENMREFVNERLTAAAEEIFGVFVKTIVEYQEEIDRQRKLLDNGWKPAMKLHRTEQHVYKEEEEEEVLCEQQHLCIQQRSSSLDQEDPEPPQIKEEQEELCTSQEGDHLELKQETETFMVTPTHEETDHSEDMTLIFNPDDAVNLPVISYVVSAPKSDHELLSHNTHEAESQDHKRGRNGDSGSTKYATPKGKKKLFQRKGPTKRQSNPTMSMIDSNTPTDKMFFQCDTCEKTFQFKSQMQRHLLMHTGEKPFSCHTCGKRFNRASSLTDHKRIHTELRQQHVCKEMMEEEEALCDQQLSIEERSPSLDQEDPEPPQIKEEQEELCTSQEEEQLELKQETETFMLTPNCEEILCQRNRPTKSQSNPSISKIDSNTHTDKKKVKCVMCGKAFQYQSFLQRHLLIHTGEKLFTCDTCGKRFSRLSSLTDHKTIHTGEKPYLCKTCGKAFRLDCILRAHMMTHKGERLYSCNVCGKRFCWPSRLKAHMRIHAADEPLGLFKMNPGK